MRTQLKLVVIIAVLGLLDLVGILLLRTGLKREIIVDLLKGGPFIDAVGAVFGLLFLLAMVSFVSLLLVNLIWDWILNWVDIFQGKPPSSTIV